MNCVFHFRFLFRFLFLILMPNQEDRRYDLL